MKRNEAIARKQHDQRASQSNRFRAGSRFAPLRSPGACPGQEPENKRADVQLWSGLMSWQRAARFRRTLVVVKRLVLRNESSCLERGSAATRTVVRSISSVSRLN